MRTIDVIVDDVVQTQVVRKWRITFWSDAYRIIESSLSLPELYSKYENAAKIEEIDCE